MKTLEQKRKQTEKARQSIRPKVSIIFEQGKCSQCLKESNLKFTNYKINSEIIISTFERLCGHCLLERLDVLGEVSFKSVLK